MLRPFMFFSFKYTSSSSFLKLHLVKEPIKDYESNYVSEYYQHVGYDENFM